jgi:ABC-type nitrate/sulfonate/bicarbonate transport system substrate-binding protein
MLVYSLLASIRSFAIALTVTTALVSHGWAQDKGLGFALKNASAGADIPKTNVSLGMRPVANDLIFVAGIKLGYFNAVGVTITPTPYGRKVLFDQAIPLLINKQIDLQALYPPDVIAALDSVKNVRFIALTDLFQGFAILAHPDTGAKTINDFMSEGKSFEDAMKATMAQLKGQKFATAPNIDNRIFLDTVFKLGGLDMTKDTELVITPDANAQQLAANGGLKFQSPDGAPFTAQLRGAGWLPLVTPLDVLTHMPAGPGSPTAALVGTPGVATDADWARRNPETVLRFLSVMFRIVHDEKANPERVLGAMLDYVNGFAGTSLNIAGLKLTIDALSPLSDFEFQKKYCDNKDSALYYRTAFDAAVKFNIDKGVLPKAQYDADDLIWACDAYHNLVDLKQASDELLRKVSAATPSVDKQALVDQAKVQYNNFNYLDAYRMLRVAAE